MKSLLVLAILFTLLAPSALGQYSCSPVERSGFYGGSISLQTSSNIGPLTIGNAEAYWTNACGGGVSIPSFSVDNGNADLQIPVTYHFTYSADGCGSTTWFQSPLAGAKPTPITIDLYQTGPDEQGNTIQCNPTDTLAHEIGHVLGLGHAPSDACRGEIMGRAVDGQPRSVLSGDCATADANWYTPIEYDRDHSAPPPPSGERPRDNPGSETANDGCGDDCSPIIINFERGAYRLTGSNAPVRFAMNPNHEPTLMGWTEAGADEAFLWLDRNQNGKVTSGADLFGNFTRLRSGAFAKNGFEALQEFDDNHDGVIDSRDPVWLQLMLWRDVNHNAISEPSEITPLADSAVIAIDLHDHWTGKHDAWGNTWRYESLVTIWNAGEHGARKQPVYDIFFASVGH